MLIMRNRSARQVTIGGFLVERHAVHKAHGDAVGELETSPGVVAHVRRPGGQRQARR